jgi:hypothetical protein
MFDDELGDLGGPTCLCCGGALRVANGAGWTVRSCTACGLETVSETGALTGRIARALLPRRSTPSSRDRSHLRIA